MGISQKAWIAEKVHAFSFWGEHNILGWRILGLNLGFSNSISFLWLLKSNDNHVVN
jgi:hypothetical protein